MDLPAAVGRYRINGTLGSGTFASVWLGHDEELQSPVAIKVLAASQIDDLDVRNRFVEEARILRRADSVRLVRVHDIGELPDGRPYFVMSYADRGTLADRIKEGALPVDQAIRLAVEISKGVAVINRLGVIHRDLKPSNILFKSVEGGGERVLIADLGLAKETAQASGAFTLPVGTPGYMSPEQAQFGGGLDIRADVYGLGALTYHLLTGRPPGSTPVRTPPSGQRSEVSPEIDEIVMRALETDREKRWQSAEEFASAFTKLGMVPPTPVPGDSAGVVIPAAPQASTGPPPGGGSGSSAAPGSPSPADASGRQPPADASTAPQKPPGPAAAPVSGGMAASGDPTQTVRVPNMPRSKTKPPARPPDQPGPPGQGAVSPSRPTVPGSGPIPRVGPPHGPGQSAGPGQPPGPGQPAGPGQRAGPDAREPAPASAPSLEPLPPVPPEPESPGGPGRVDPNVTVSQTPLPGGPPIDPNVTVAQIPADPNATVRPDEITSPDSESTQETAPNQLPRSQAHQPVPPKGQEQPPSWWPAPQSPPQNVPQEPGAHMSPARPTTPKPKQQRPAPGPPGGGPGKPKRGKRRGLLILGIVGLAVLLIGGAAGAFVVLSGGDDKKGKKSPAPADDFAAVSDSGRRITVKVPKAWVKQPDEQWPAGVAISDRSQMPALRATPDLNGFRTDDKPVPGVFVGLTRDLNAQLPPAGPLSDHTRNQPPCVKGQPQQYQRAGLSGQITPWAQCGNTGITYNEVALQDANKRFALWIRVKQTGGEDLTRKILDTVQVTAQ